MPKQHTKPVGKSFPNLALRVASYDPATQITIFEEMDLDRFKEVMNNPSKKGNERDMSVIIHEYRHCIDHLGTLWGQNHLLKLQRALNAVISQDENEIQFIDEYKKEEIESMQNLSFYSVAFEKYLDDVTERGWIIQPVAHEIKDERYVNNGKYFFSINFYSLNKNHIVTLPLSILSLLEANASFDEILSMIVGINTRNEDDETIVDTILYLNEIIDKSRNVDVILYNVVFQLTSGLLVDTHWFEVYLISSMLATLALNLPYKLIERLPLNNYEGDFELAEALLKEHNYGFIFYIMLINYAKVYVQGNILNYNLEDVLRVNNLPDQDIMFTIIKDEFENIADKIRSCTRLKKRFLEYNSIGSSILEVGGLDGKNGNVFTKFSKRWAPPYALIDGGVEPQLGYLEQLDAAEYDIRNADLWYNIVRELDDIMEKRYNS